jgi:hypothetical protein
MAIKRKREQQMVTEPEPDRIAPEIGCWLSGMLSALDRLNREVREALAHHSLAAASHLEEITYSINTALKIIDEAVAAQPPRSDAP